ncbi:ferrochelatase [Corynebacterium sp. CCUG 65737]|uniref:ferrochelatase n=1 Tax=unclassified Corynebacterium TaxID=2624378 RepID=UPI00210A74EA|nr:MULTISPECIES: ferrochelatase [unclassified Corynebacterium]MCQ4618804.1 ferrochelatase [Corynebacterium pseudogenitalium]MCQ4622162.1 ferrochelatase [Corynebacterium sp. CCUG 70398]MCQ4627142.1 ferrochelatase [Corynebacterium sp. CCUG 65737]
MSLSDFDALLVLSFGGPEGEDEVIPFLENVTKGRGIPRERLAEVGEHYFNFGGVSPINEQNRTIISNIEAEIERRGETLPVYFGNRNWRPFALEAADEIKADGHRNVAVFATSAWGGYSACRQYDEDIVKLRESHGDIEFTKLWQFYGHPTFVSLMADHVRQAWEAADQATTRVLFTAHSVPNAADDASGGPTDANLYSRQVEEASRLIAEAAGLPSYEVVWQSRSGNPATPWLEPDVVDRTEELHDEDSSIKHIICVPVGFITDHMEVIWDLDTELKEACDERGITLTRTPTVGLEPEFANLVLNLVENTAAGTEPKTLSTITVQGCTLNGAPCKEGCCTPQRPQPQS